MRKTTCVLCVWLVPALVSAQHSADVAEATSERLTLAAAVRLAIDNNRSLQAARLQIEKADDELEVVRTRRLPAFETTAQSSMLLSPVSFAFPAGAFGSYPGTGPIPAADTTVESPRQPMFTVSAQLTQPLSQLFEIGLNIRGAKTNVELERERAREKELALVNSVKRLYYAILQTESALSATKEAIALYQELDRSLDVRVTQKVALRSDALDVQFRLAQEEVTRIRRQHTLDSQKEQLNQLLGRSVRTPFHTESFATLPLVAIDLESAHARALADRPDVRTAKLDLEQAELDRRIKKAAQIPDVSVAVSYQSNFNIDVLPRNLASVGVQVSWEPFDWGRRGREVAAKERTIRQARLAVQEAEDRAIVEINSRYRSLEEARALLDAVAVAQRSSREKLRVKTNQFQIQAAMLADVLQARAEMANADDQFQQALLTFLTAKADFEHAAGEEGIQ
jgi:outer membrane protein TolC